MSVATIRPAAVVYREEQNFDWRAYALVVLIEIALAFLYVWTDLNGRNHGVPDVGGLPSKLMVTAVMVTLAVAAVVMFRMTTEVTPTDVRVWFGWVPLYRRLVPLGSIQRLEVVTFRPILDYAGWGIRRGRDGERVLTARGDRGVRLELADGTRLLIGSQRPESLARALERAMRAGV